MNQRIQEKNKELVLSISIDATARQVVTKTEKVLMRNEGISTTDQEGREVRSMARLLASAEKELFAFVAAVNELFDAEQARRAADDWMEELERTGWPSEAPAID
jgi:hypothetical protein